MMMQHKQGDKSPDHSSRRSRTRSKSSKHSSRSSSNSSRSSNHSSRSSSRDSSPDNPRSPKSPKELKPPGLNPDKMAPNTDKLKVDPTDSVRGNPKFQEANGKIDSMSTKAEELKNKDISEMAKVPDSFDYVDMSNKITANILDSSKNNEKERSAKIIFLSALLVR